jgi:hypothetical protein
MYHGTIRKSLKGHNAKRMLYILIVTFFVISFNSCNCNNTSKFIKQANYSASKLITDLQERKFNKMYLKLENKRNQSMDDYIKMMNDSIIKFSNYKIISEHCGKPNNSKYIRCLQVIITTNWCVKQQRLDLYFWRINNDDYLLDNVMTSHDLTEYKYDKNGILIDEGKPNY